MGQSNRTGPAGLQPRRVHRTPHRRVPRRPAGDRGHPHSPDARRDAPELRSPPSTKARGRSLPPVSSNLLRRDNQFLHTRCFTDATRHVHDTVQWPYRSGEAARADRRQRVTSVGTIPGRAAERHPWLTDPGEAVAPFRDEVRWNIDSEAGQRHRRVVNSRPSHTKTWWPLSNRTIYRPSRDLHPPDATQVGHALQFSKVRSVPYTALLDASWPARRGRGGLLRGSQTERRGSCVTFVAYRWRIGSSLAEL